MMLPQPSKMPMYGLQFVNATKIWPNRRELTTTSMTYGCGKDGRQNEGYNEYHQESINLIPPERPAVIYLIAQ